MTSQLADMTFSCCHVSLAETWQHENVMSASYWTKFHVSIMTGFGVMIVFNVCL